MTNRNVSGPQLQTGLVASIAPPDQWFQITSVGWFVSDASPLGQRPPPPDAGMYYASSTAIPSARDARANAILIPETEQVKRNPDFRLASAAVHIDVLGGLP